MNQVLKNALSKAQELPEAQQDRLAGLITEFVEQTNSDSFDEDMKDPNYRAYVETELKLSESDLKNGRYKLASKSFASLKAKYKAQHGL